MLPLATPKWCSFQNKSHSWSRSSPKQFHSSLKKKQLVAGLEHQFYFSIGNFIIPPDQLIFFVFFSSTKQSHIHIWMLSSPKLWMLPIELLRPALCRCYADESAPHAKTTLELRQMRCAAAFRREQLVGWWWVVQLKQNCCRMGPPRYKLVYKPL